MDGAEARRILDEYFPRKQRTISRSYSTKKYNIIGFSTEDIIEYKHCPLDVGVRLIKIKGALTCPRCGYVYRKEEAPNEEGIQPQHEKQQTTAIVSGKRKKKSNIPEDIQKEIGDGRLVYYHEELPTK